MVDAPESGKAGTKKTAEEAYDEIAAREGFDENGDDLPVVDESPEDDEPLLAGEDDNEDGHEETVASEEAEGEEVQPPDPEDEAPVTETATGADGLLEAPHTWPKEWKDAYNQIDSPEVRKAVHDMTGHMNRAFSQRMMELSETRREYEGLSRSLAPHMERLQRGGLTPEMAVSRALGWDAHIQRDPVQGWLDYGKALGIDPAQVLQAQQRETRYMTPTERAIMEANQGVEQRLEANERRVNDWFAQQQEREARERQARATVTLQRFMTEKDDAGNLKHPHVDLVAGVMTRLIDGPDPAASTLEEAYEMAAANNPQIKAAREKIRKATQVRGAQEKVKKVRKASGGIVGKAGKPAKPAKTFEERAAENYDKIANG